MEDVEEIKVYFDPTTINIDWKKRNKRKIFTTSIYSNIKKYNLSYKIERKTKKLYENVTKQDKINNLKPTEKTKDEQIKEIKERLNKLIKINPNKIPKGGIKTLYELIDINIKKLKNIDTNNALTEDIDKYLKEIERLKKIQRKNSKKAKSKTTKDSEIQRKLHVLRKKVNNEVLQEKEIEKLLIKLSTLKDEIMKNTDKFKNRDNIENKLEEIDNLNNKLQELEKNKKNNEKIKDHKKYIFKIKKGKNQ